MNAEQLAKKFHDTYEELAPAFGYQTRKASAKPWRDVPEKNKQLMIAVAEKVFSIKKKQAADDCVEDCAVVDENKYLQEDIAELKAENKQLEEENRWIPVSERLPSEENCGYIDVANAKTLYADVIHWSNTNFDAKELKRKYTHWKPIILPD